LRGSRLTCHGGFHGESSMLARNNFFCALQRSEQ
jgi:hypothetical protein